MSKMFQVYGIGQALIPVLPPPLPFENPPNSNQTNYEIGQVVFSPAQAPTAFYMYGGGGNWVEFATSSGAITSVLGTGNQINASTTAGVTTLSLSNILIAPGTIAATQLTGGVGVTATTGNISANNGNLVIGTPGGKLVIAAGTNGSVGVTPAMTAGAVTVATTAVTANSIILYAVVTPGGTVGTYTLTKTAGTSFTITSTSGTETSTFNYEIIN